MQILREINFEDSWSTKSAILPPLETLKGIKNAIFAILGIVNFVELGRFQPSKSVKIHIIQNSEPLNVYKRLIFYF